MFLIPTTIYAELHPRLRQLSAAVSTEVNRLLPAGICPTVFMKFQVSSQGKLNWINSLVKFFFMKTQVGILAPNNISVFNPKFSEINRMTIFIVLWMRMI